jgi:radical SAM superfamily enzyme YgiQ (UPF0313 family)
MAPARGNVPLAAGYLKLFARLRGLEEAYDISIFPPALANRLSDQGIVAAILEREPFLVGFTCYLWNIDRTLWIAQRLKEHRPELKIVLGGPEITPDNAWVLKSPGLDFAAIGEGEQTLVDLLSALENRDVAGDVIPGLYVAPPGGRPGSNGAASSPHGAMPPFRQPLPNLNEISSPYLAGILDAAEEQMLLLETIRGCIFKCKFCYYPKSYDALYFLDQDKIVANLQHAAQRGAKEVVLLDPTLNQRRDFLSFVRLLAQCNPHQQFTYFGELRAEGITEEIAHWMRQANFTEVEIGLQSIDPLAQELMDRKNNLRAIERGARALLHQGIQVKMDLIIGLPGDTAESVRRGFRYLLEGGLYSSVQVFNLSVLPGTAFRHEAPALGLEFQERSPYYVLRTPTLDLAQMFDLMQEAQELFDTEFDPLPPPEIPQSCGASGRVNGSTTAGAESVAGCNIQSLWQVDLDLPPADRQPLAPPGDRSQAFTLWLQGSQWHDRPGEAAGLVRRLLRDNPHSTLQVILEPRTTWQAITAELLESIRQACYETTSYLDRFYSLTPGRTKSAKRQIVLLPASLRNAVADDWSQTVGQYASLAWRGAIPSGCELSDHEYAVNVRDPL